MNNRVAVITGALSGIGLSTAKLLAARGAKVALLARRKEVLDQAVNEIRAAGGEALALAVDVTDQASVDAAAAAVESAYGPANLVFNNAGVMLPGAIEARETAAWEHQIDLNVTGVMRVISAFVPQLVKSAEQGATVDLINTSSIAAQNIYPYFAVYSGTKAYVSHLSRHLRAELGPKDIRVSLIEPGITETELQGHWTFQGAKDWFAGAAQSMEFLQPQDVAEVVAFLAAQPKHVNLQQVVVMPTKQAT
ncbi:SDR family NAD(P)-dependent oxidoreductase [Pseudoduganella sp. FT25W]|uniref:SDR family NAD(P)-dependent oxidoreductase n=1 Tax=Duganella alba TaxID=2666081 RepID=A0A6L5QLD0_9BURK|nr:SDR family oxidoreductase [Duganella alba]MRX09741.1 SDR family NAD(P)-dependent oxidoreductase [Duganella alba]MRX17378.1 SDR family NAD(P)-dependent oxidoreductase [Duganella alba]